MKIVIQCAASKYDYAGYMQNKDDNKINFVANPALIGDHNFIYANPNDKDENGLSWQDVLIQYNKSGSNPYNLLPAYQLYKNRAYKQLVEKFGIDNVYILSAGWGLIKAGFLTPKYDITFSSKADGSKKRTDKDNYYDFNMLENSTEDLVFIGGKRYIKLFVELTSHYDGKKIIYYNSNAEPIVPNGYILEKHNTKTRTNWHYGVARDLVVG